MVWMKVQLDEATDEALRLNAARRGMSLAQYLRALAATDRQAPREVSDSLRARLRAHLDEAATLEPRPTTPAADSFAEAVRRKFRAQGLRG